METASLEAASLETPAEKTLDFWRYEAKILIRSSAPLILTYLLQYSLIAVGFVIVGRIGQDQLGAIALANMTYNITGLAVNFGLATALDTLCAQAYGGGHKKAVGLHFLRMLCFCYMMSALIAVAWWFSAPILRLFLVNESEAVSVHLASVYLRVMIFALPGLAMFECGKRFLQAQNIFSANFIFMVGLAPLNALLQWILVWKTGLGFIGAPIAVAITYNLLGLCLIVYVCVLGYGRECLVAPSLRELFSNWGPMVRLALPGLIMLLAEFIAFEVLTLWAGILGPSYLAAQGALLSTATLCAELTLSFSIAVSVRTAHLIGAGQVQVGRRAARVALTGSFINGIVLMAIVLAGQAFIPEVFNLKGEARSATKQLLPFVAVFQLLDSTQLCLQGLLRGIGAQKVTGYISLLIMNGVSLPLSWVFAFVLHWKLIGLWAGLTTALLIIWVVYGLYIYFTSWDRAAEEARERAPLLRTLSRAS